MKLYNLLKVAAISLAALLFSSCEKQDIPESRYEATFYVGCYTSDTGSCIYKDDKILYNLGGNASVKGVVLMQDGSIYASGTVFGETENEKEITAFPTIWKDGNPIEMDFTPESEGMFQNIVANGDKWASCAIVINEEGLSYGCVVENGKILYTTEGESESDIYFLSIDCGASGDYYVLADYPEGIKLLRISSGTPNHLVSTEMIALHDEGSVWLASCLHVGVSDIAVGLNRLYTSGNPSTDAYVWVNGNRCLDCLEEDSEINDITFYGGHLVAAGNNITGIGSDQPGTTAVQWVNGQHQDFSYGCTGNSSVTLVRNWNDIFLFQCVQSEKGLQLCDNGRIYKEINVPGEIISSCWDVVVTKIQ